MLPVAVPVPFFFNKPVLVWVFLCSYRGQGNCKVAGTLRRAVRRTAGNPDFPRTALGECLLFLPQEDFAVLLVKGYRRLHLAPPSVNVHKIAAAPDRPGDPIIRQADEKNLPVRRFLVVEAASITRRKSR